MVDAFGDTPLLRRGRRKPQRLDPAGTHPETPGPFRPRPGPRDLPEHITVHLDAGYDSHKAHKRLAILGRNGRISTKNTPLQADTRWVLEHTNSRHNRDFRKLLIYIERRTSVIDAFIIPATPSSSYAASSGRSEPPTDGTNDPNNGPETYPRL